MVGEERCQILKRHTFSRLLGQQTIDADNLRHGEETLIILRRTHGALHRVTGLECILADLLLGDIYIVRRRQVVIIRRTEETVPLGQDLQCTGSCDGTFDLKSCTRRQRVSWLLLLRHFSLGFVLRHDLRLFGYLYRLLRIHLRLNNLALAASLLHHRFFCHRLNLGRLHFRLRLDKLGLVNRIEHFVLLNELLHSLLCFAHTNGQRLLGLRLLHLGHCLQFTTYGSQDTFALHVLRFNTLRSRRRQHDTCTPLGPKSILTSLISTQRLIGLRAYYSIDQCLRIQRLSISNAELCGYRQQFVGCHL